MYEIERTIDGSELLIIPPVEGVSCHWDEFSRDMGDWVLTTPNGVQYIDCTEYAIYAIEEYLGIAMPPKWARECEND